VPVVEDAVPALGVRLRGQALGTLGAAGAFSTQSDKSLNTGEGGFVVCRDPVQFARAVALSGAYEGRYTQSVNVRAHMPIPRALEFIPALSRVMREAG
jgi:dTDP-4-amino-4,6-dideoxygalactose transaminase